LRADPSADDNTSMKVAIFGQMLDLPTVLAKQGHTILWYSTSPLDPKKKLTAEITARHVPIETLRTEPQPEVANADLLLVNLTAHQISKGVLRQLVDFYPKVSIIYNKDRWRPGRAPIFEFPVRGLSFKEQITGSLIREKAWVDMKRRVFNLRAIMEDAKKVLILTHNNPDPDSIASALALRTLLGRNNRTATIGYLGDLIHRPENRQMLELLDIDAKNLRTTDLDSFDRICLVDCQPPYISPPYFDRSLPRVDAVFDHHPELPGYTVPFKEVRPTEGATSTILTTLLRAADIEPSERLATALLYAIKTDTFFMRDAAPYDIDCFTYLYPLANMNQIRRMEKPEIDSAQLLKFGEAIRRHVIFGKVFTCYAGEGIREDMIARLADFGLQTRGVEWSVAFGFEEDILVMSMRNPGYVKAAGRILRKCFGEIGSAGGHRNSARALITKTALRKAHGKDFMKKLDTIIIRPILDEIEGESDKED
jgi:nanoRNase/pAp phosphatase (c-di-AMP/oligoRNAs hydrolase)